MARDKTRRLSDEDKVLWRKVTESTTPLVLTGLIKAAPNAGKTDPIAPKVARPALAKPPQKQTLPPPVTGGAQGPAMDAKAYRKMKGGKLTPEARLDLHGLTLAQAQPRLTHFITKAAADGRRLVLVITGKGRGSPEDGPLPVRPGALRHAVPHWLHAAPLRPLVLQITESHRRHGGEGAYYVYLRRRR